MICQTDGALQNKRKNSELSDRWGLICRTRGRTLICQTDGALQNNRKNNLSDGWDFAEHQEEQ